MNKILMDTRNYHLIIKKDEVYFLTNEEDLENLVIDVKENTKSTIYLLFKNLKSKIYINLEANAFLTVNSLALDSSIDIYSNLKPSSTLYYVNSIITNKDSINNIEIKEESNASCNFYIQGINLANKKLYFRVDGIIKKNCCNVYLNENTQIINILDGDSKIIPNLMVSLKDVSAIHSAYIGTFNKEALWYLNSRGLSDTSAKKILIKAFLLKNMQLNELEENFNEFLTLI